MSEELRKELRKKRGYIKAKQTKIWKFAESIHGKRISPDIETLTIYADRLETYYKEFENIQQRLLVASEEDELSADDQREDDDFDTKYMELKAFLSKSITELGPSVRTTPRVSTNDPIARVLEQQNEIIRTLSSPVISQGASHLEHRVKLPIFNLPSFSGELHEWKRFSDSFTALIHNSELSALEKHQYLVSVLSGSAAKVIESVEISANNYELAWTLLKNRYEDEKALRRRRIQCLFEAPKVERESAVAIQILIDNFRKHLRVVRSMDSAAMPWGKSLVLYMIEERLDQSTRRHWEENMEGEQNVSVDSLFEFLQRRVKMLERLGKSSGPEQSNVRGIGGQGGRTCSNNAPRTFGGSSSARSARMSRSGSSGTSVSLAAAATSGRCYVCNGPHFIYSCDKFLGVSTPERIELVKRLKLCFNCLKNDHFVGSCKASSCRLCSERHNTLCHKQDEQASVEASAGPSVDSGARASNRGSRASSVLSVHHASKRTRSGQVLMSTAVVNARGSNGLNQSIRVLLDSASEANFITSSACSKLNVKPERIQEIVTGVNNLTCTITQGCRVTVESRVVDYQLSAFCLIVPQITRSLPSVAVDAGKFAITSTLKLADPKYFHPSQIDMLLGGEFFLTLLESAKIELGIDLPTLHNTKFGWVISGIAPIQL